MHLNYVNQELTWLLIKFFLDQTLCLCAHDFSLFKLFDISCRRRRSLSSASCSFCLSNSRSLFAILYIRSFRFHHSDPKKRCLI